MILLFVTVAAFAGRRVTIRLDGRPAMELIEAIEGQTGLRVLGDPAVLDSLTVTVDVRDAEVIMVGISPKAKKYHCL